MFVIEYFKYLFDGRYVSETEASPSIGSKKLINLIKLEI